jgi:hypothetical protein
MTLLQHFGPGLLLLGLAGAACAQTAAPVAVAAPAGAASTPARDRLTPTLTVIEDDGVRIEEKRLRGQPQRITVQSKVGAARPYEIIVGTDGRDPSKDRGAVGQSAWSLFDF